jgi:hypothetical protein
MLSRQSKAPCPAGSGDRKFYHLTLGLRDTFSGHRKNFLEPFRSSEEDRTSVPSRRSRTRGLAWQAALILSLPLATAWAASPFEEGFDTDTSGWTGLNQNLQHDASGYVFIQFPELPVAVPESAAIQALSGASGGAFTGNYVTANARLMGLDFIALDSMPSEVLLRWTGTNGKAYFVSLVAMLSSTGVWHRFVFSLHDKNTGNWVGDPAEDFEDTLSQVDKVEISILRGDETLQRYGVDNFFTAALPEVDSIQQDNGTIRLHWIFLRVGTEYTLESANDAGGTYTPVSSFTAMANDQEILDTAPPGAPGKVYKLTR